MKNFTIKNKWRQILCGHSEALRGEVYNAVVEYVAEGRIVEMSEAAAVAFDFIRYDIDASSRSKAKRVECKDNAVSEERAGCEVMTPEAEATVAESREAESSGGEEDAEVRLRHRSRSRVLKSHRYMRHKSKRSILRGSRCPKY